jgi:hypothetical protein
MRVFISFARADAELAAKVEDALRRRKVQTWSSLDVGSGEEWKRVLDRESANADVFLFLIGASTSVNAQLQSEWRSLLRNDWDSKKPLILYLHGALSDSRKALPPFLRSRKAISTTNYDVLVEELRRALEHPEDTIDREQEERGKLEQEKRLDELKDYALALKQENETGDVKHQ